MYVDAHASNLPDLKNPCDDKVNQPNEFMKYVHERPVLSYNNNLWNPPTRTEVGIFNTDGSPKAVNVLVAESGMEESDMVDGGSSIPGDINYYSNFPEAYKNHLFLVDYHGFISTLKLNEEYEPVNIKKFADLPKGITDCAFSPKDGRLYYINHLESEVRRIEFGGILPPIIHLEVDKNFGPGPLAVHFDASQSISNSETALDFEWNFDDGQTANGEIVDHIFEGTGVKLFIVELKVTDSLGLQSVKHQIISINNSPPQPKITSIEDGSSYSINDYTVALLNAVVEDEEQEKDELEYVWRADFYHDEHYHPGPPIEKEEAYLIIDPLGCGEELYWYQIYLEVTDAGGLKGIDSVFVYPYCGPEFVEIFDLSGAIINDKIKLNWKTSFEEGMDSFIIEKAPDHLFQNIGSLSAGKANYEFIDKAPFTGLNYYRIRGVNQNGDYLFSNTISVELKEDKFFKIFPNPNNGNFVFQHYSDTSEPVKIYIYSIGGVLLRSVVLQNNVNKVETVDFDFSEFESGVYFIKAVSGENQQMIKWFKF
jgi:hypothetical protein